jgi:hypothetical protein
VSAHSLEFGFRAFDTYNALALLQLSGLFSLESNGLKLSPGHPHRFVDKLLMDFLVGTLQRRKNEC